MTPPSTNHDDVGGSSPADMTQTNSPRKIQNNNKNCHQNSRTKLSSVAFIGPSSPKAFGNSFDSLTTKFDNNNNIANHQDALLPTRNFVQYFEESGNDDQNQTKLFACANRFMSAERFLDLLRRSKAGDVFVFSGTCRLTTTEFNNDDIITSEQIFDNFCNLSADVICQEDNHESPAEMNNADYESNGDDEGERLEQQHNNNIHDHNIPLPSDAYLWFSGASWNEPGKWVSGKEITKALEEAKQYNQQHNLCPTTSASSSCCGTLILNCDYACFAAQHQHDKPSHFLTNARNNINNNHAIFERVRKSMIPILLTSGSNHEQELSKTTTNNNIIASIMSNHIDFRNEFAIPFICKCNNDSCVDDYLHVSKSNSNDSSPPTSSCLLSLRQGQQNIIPLSYGPITPMPLTDFIIRQRTSKLKTKRQHEHEKHDQDLEVDLADEGQDDDEGNDFANALSEPVETAIVGHLFARFAHLGLAQFHRYVARSVPGGAMIWSDTMILIRFDPDADAHQQAIVDMYESREWQETVGTHMEGKECARKFLENRPQKMFHEVGTGSFAVLVPQQRHRAQQQKQHHHPIVGMFGAILRPEMEGDFDLGVGLHPDYFGKGYGTTAASMILRWARHGIGLRRIRSITGTNNVAALKLLEDRLGFTKMFDGEAKFYSWKDPNYVLVKELY